MCSRPLMGLLLTLVLAGCGDAPDAELHTWMAEERSSLKPKSVPVDPPKPFQPIDYTAAAKVDPFAIQKLIVGLRAEQTSSTSSSSLIAAEQSRRREPLEAYPLDALTMVGTLQKNGKQAALLKVDKLIYQVEVGAYLGQNYGKVVKISDTEVVLREIVQDGAGEWVERRTALQLQEGK